MGELNEVKRLTEALGRRGVCGFLQGCAALPEALTRNVRLPREAQRVLRRVWQQLRIAAVAGVRVALPSALQRTFCPRYLVWCLPAMLSRTMAAARAWVAEFGRDSVWLSG